MSDQPAEPLTWMRQAAQDAYDFFVSHGEMQKGYCIADIARIIAKHVPASPVPERTRDIAESCAKIAETTAFGDRAARAIREHFKGLPATPAKKETDICSDCPHPVHKYVCAASTNGVLCFCGVKTKLPPPAEKGKP